MKILINIAVSTFIFQTACISVPGQTVTFLGGTPVSVSYEYTKWYGGEMQATMQLAETHCQTFGKHARLTAQTPAGPNPIDRSVAVYDCIA